MTVTGSRFDVIVIGLGGLGSATAWQLARRGRRVLGLEQFGLGHTRGASHGDSRIVRLSYHTPTYVLNAAESLRDWAQVEADAGERLVTRTGGIDLFPPGASTDIDTYTSSMAAAGVPFELVDAATTAKRWPAFAPPDGTRVLFQEQTGHVAAGRAVEVMQARATAHGATLRADSAVAELVADGDGVVVTTRDGSTYRADAAVVTADAWTNQVLAGLDAHLPLTVTREQALHYSVSDLATHDASAMPVWIWMDDPSFYGFPMVGEATVKVGEDCGGPETDPDVEDTATDPVMQARSESLVHRLLPGTGPVTRVTRCLYTLTPDRDFVADRVPGHGNVVVGLGAAHGFKFAPWFGRVLADLAMTGSTTSDISAFTLDRPGLTRTPAAQNWLF